MKYQSFLSVLASFQHVRQGKHTFQSNDESSRVTPKPLSYTESTYEPAICNNDLVERSVEDLKLHPSMHFFPSLANVNATVPGFLQGKSRQALPPE